MPLVIVVIWVAVVITLVVQGIKKRGFNKHANTSN